MGANPSRVTQFEVPGLRIPEPSINPDQLFASLDGKDVVVRGRKWRIEVYSVCDMAGARWIQLALDGLPHHMVALRLAVGQGMGPAIRAISSWLANPSSSPVAVLTVAS